MHSSQLNNSVSKQLYSFSKAQRFPQTVESPCKERFYNFRVSSLTNRSTSLGYGNKIDLANKEDVPGPGSYRKEGEFIINKVKRRGYSFSRHDKRSIINQEQTVKIPGPGKYQIDKDIKFTQLKYSFRSKFQSIFEKNEHSLGPGQYRTLQVINKDGHHNLSKYHDSQSRRFSRSVRFEELRARTPGPGQYKDAEKLAINKTGSYFNSRFRNNCSNVFGRSERPSLGLRTLSPGPGKYDAFSQFNTSR